MPARTKLSGKKPKRILPRLEFFFGFYFWFSTLTWDQRADIKHWRIILWYFERLTQIQDIVNFRLERLTFPQNLLIIAVFSCCIKFVLISCFREHPYFVWDLNLFVKFSYFEKKWTLEEIKASSIISTLLGFNDENGH